MQKSLLNDVARMKTLFVFLLWMGVMVGSWSCLAATAAAVTPVKKVVCQYALTSANDFPSRDPKDWRLMGSNDGGKTWSVLDVRKGELFTERQQRRLFKIPHPAAFSLYRLQIDRVRNPQDADAIQLAEIEPLGVRENDFNTLPIYADRISAKGDNPPLETALQAFDGRKVTKWVNLSDERYETLGSWIEWEYLSQTGLVVTNVQQLSLLRGRADENYPVRIQGVFIGREEYSQLLIVLDNTGWVEVSTAEPMEGLHPAQSVLLPARSRWTGTGPGVEAAAITAMGTLPAAEPQVLQLGQNLRASGDFQWVKVEGTVAFPVQSGNQIKFELQENKSSLPVRVLAGNRLQQLPAVGNRVRVSGVCAPAYDDKGKLVPGVLWVAGLSDIVLLDKPGSSTGPPAVSDQDTTREGKGALMTEIEQIRQLTTDQLGQGIDVQVGGVVTEMFGDYVQQGNDGIELIWPNNVGLQPRNFGCFVEVRGKTTRGDAGGPAILVNQVQVLGKAKLPEPEHPSWSQLAGGEMNGDWIEMDAVVQSTDGSHLLLYHEGRQMMATIRSGSAAKIKELVDANVQLRGVCVNATDERNIVQGIQLIVPSLDFVSIKAQPLDSNAISVRPINSLYNMGSPNAFNHRVKIRGTLTCLEGRKYFVQDGGDSIMAVGKAKVILKPRARNPRWIFWQTPEDEGESQAGDNLNPGDEVEVTGYVESYGYAPMLTEAVVRSVGISKAPPTPVKTTVEELAKGRFDSSLVSVDGMVLGHEILGSHFVMQIESGQRIFQASLQINPRKMPNLALGSVVRLVGVCQMTPVSHAELGRAPGTFSILLRTANDIKLLKAPSWWTVQRVFVVVGILMFVLVAALVWVHLLHRQVDERTVQLKQEVADHEKTEGLLAEESRRLHLEIQERQITAANLAKETELLQAEIQKRIRMQEEVDKIHRQLLSASRLAGMAEVATSVLHNVGNVLNSVNVLASSISTYVEKSKISSVARLADLLGKHRDNLGEFLTEDENGRNVPGYLKRLGEHLVQEQIRMLEKAQALTESVQHIKEVVAMQQNYAKVAGVCEKVPIAEIVEDALKMCGEAMSRHKIEVIRDMEDLAPVILDRHKVLQILFNLLDNAKHACELRGDADGIIRIRIQRVGSEKIHLQVVDNGIGIPKENLSRIFTQGFSTRKRGHGFGLHSSILAAQDMGGTMSVQSDGPGLGAVFTLELPIVFERSPTSGKPQAAVAN